MFAKASYQSCFIFAIYLDNLKISLAKIAKTKRFYKIFIFLYQ
ncbi:hypothetical protein DESACE_08935 [Desulfurella acetivorans A63]|nr:hypothetical protein DESACE_08935 [Desulfurella acetivorans A63]